MKRFAPVRTWIFDLDHTLYPPTDRLFAQIDVKMRDFIVRTLGVDENRANNLRAEYWRDYGTTLAGLMARHGIRPDDYLTEVHDIDLTHMQPDPVLAQRIAALPGRRIVFTNGSKPYAEKVLAARGLGGVFDAVYGVEQAGFHAKPNAEAFDAVFALDGLDPARAAMFEDEARNLAVPHARGVRTVHIAPIAAPAPHIEFHTDDLSGFLVALG